MRNLFIHQIKQCRCVPYNMSSVNLLQMHIILHLFHMLLVHSSSLNIDTHVLPSFLHVKAITQPYKYKPLPFLFNIISMQIFLWMNVMLGLSQTVRKQAKIQHENISLQLNSNLQPLAPETGALKIKRPPLMV